MCLNFHKLYKSYSNIKSMKYILPGGAGFVGKNIVRVMLSKGIKPQDITIIDKNSKGINYLKKNYPKVNSHLYDLSEKNNEWMKLFDKHDIIILLAAQIKAKTYEPFKKNNIDSTKNVLIAAKKYNIKKIIHFSTAAVLSVRKDDYAKTKKVAEDAVVSSGLIYTVIRPSMMFGPLDDKNIGWLIKFSTWVPVFPIPGDGKYPRQPIYIDDICQLIIAWAKEMQKGKLKNKIFSINGKVLEFGYMCRTVVKKVGGLRIAVNIPAPIFKFALQCYNLIVPDPQFTSDQVDSLTSGDLFDQREWWKEYNIKLTPFDKGVENMIKKK